MKEKIIKNTNSPQPGQKNIEVPSETKQRIMKELSRASGSQVKVFAFSVNPFVILITSILAGLFIFTLLRGFGGKTFEKVTTGEFIEHIKNNEYSRVEITDASKAFGQGKKYEILELGGGQVDTSFLVDKDGVDVSVNDEDFVTLTPVELAAMLKGPSLRELLSSFKSKDAVKFADIVLLGKSFVLARMVGQNSADVLIRAINPEEFKSFLVKSNLNIENSAYEIDDLTSAAGEISAAKFRSNFELGNYTDVWRVDTTLIGRLDPKVVLNQQIDFGPLQTDFPQFLQNEGINFDNPSIEIVQIKEQKIDFGTVIQIISMILIGFMVFSILRGINGNSKGLMQFGMSRAKLFFGKKSEVTFKDVAGIDSAKEELEEIVDFLKNPKKFTDLGARIPKGLLLVGAPGTGKTLLARAISGEAGVPFFHTSGSEFEEMLVGAGASRVRDLFAKAKKASPALIFIDEIDAVARKRGTTIQSSSTEQTLNQILVEMDGFEKATNVIVIAATNRPDVLDPAILRPGRFDRRIVIELPDIKGREEILKIHAKNKPLDADVNLTKVARRTVGYSGADLENMLNEAAIIAAKDNRKKVKAHDIEEAANRLVMGRERKLERTQEEIKRTAYHEAGHAIVAKLTPESDPVHRITIVSRGMALGVTMQLPERDKYSQSITELRSRLRVLMAGRAAEELIYGPDKITSGASNDIEKATSIARKMVKLFGFSKKLGMVKYGESNELQYLGYGYGEQRDYSEHTAQTIDDEVKMIVDEAYANALDILVKHRKTLEKISEDLVIKEVMEGDEFEKYFKEKPDNVKSKSGE